jgi:hypothetical protein
LSAKLGRLRLRGYAREVGMTSTATIEYSHAEREDDEDDGWRGPSSGREFPCVIATCDRGGHSVEIWGHGINSVKRALATLSRECSCGAHWHEAGE